MKPFNFNAPASSIKRPTPPEAMMQMQSAMNKVMAQDYPGRVQVQEGTYTGGGARSAFIGRSDGDLGMKMPAWPVVNTNPFGK